MKAFSNLCKAIFDRVIACFLLLITMPLLLLGLALLRILGTGPTIVTQNGETRDGRLLHYHRLRTYGHESAAFLYVGQKTRELSVDLLPGLWSVMVGDISLRAYLDLVTLETNRRTSRGS